MVSTDQKDKRAEVEGETERICGNYVEVLPLTSDDKLVVKTHCVIKLQEQPLAQRTVIQAGCANKQQDPAAVDQCVAHKTLNPDSPWQIADLAKAPDAAAECEKESLNAQNARLEQDFRRRCYNALPDAPLPKGELPPDQSGRPITTARRIPDPARMVLDLVLEDLGVVQTQGKSAQEGALKNLGDPSRNKHGVAKGSSPFVESAVAEERAECKNCGQRKETLSVIDDGKSYLLPREWFENEEEVRNVIMNGFLKKGVDVWDCPAEFNRVKEPIIIDGIPFGISIGDFPFRWKGAYYIVELKFLKIICAPVSESAYTPYGYISPGKFSFRRIPKFILDGQSKMLREGGGFLIVVAEPSLKTVGLKQLFTDTAEDCQKRLLVSYKNKLAKNEIPYEVWILNQKSFLRLWNEVLVGETAKPVGKDKWGKTDIRRTLSISGLNTVVQDERTLLTVSEIVEGKITDIILEKISDNL